MCYGLIVQGYAVWKLRHALDGRRLLPMMIGGQLGIPIGVEFLRWLPAADMRAAIGVVLVAFSLYSLLQAKAAAHGQGRPASGWQCRRRERNRGRRDRPCRHPADHLGGAARLDQGRAARRLPAGRRHDLCRVPGMAGRHRQLRPADLLLFLAGLPALFAGSWLGLRLYGRLDEAGFRKVVLAFLLLAGTALAAPLMRLTY